jgi:hypothetical protein
METTINKINKYTHTSSDEFDGYEETLTGVLRLHKDKLDAYLKAPEMNKLIKIKLENTFAGKYNGDGKRMYSDAQIKKIIEETDKEMNAEVYSIIMATIDNNQLKKTLRRSDYRDDGYAAFQYIKARWSTTATATRDIRLSNINEKRKEHVDGGLASFDLRTTSAWYNTLLDLNAELEGSEYEMSSKAIVTTLLDAISVHDFQYVRNFKTNNKSLLADHNKVWDELSVILEDSDRREAKVRAQEQRNALRADKVPSADVAQLVSSLVDAKLAGMSASAAKKTFPLCKKCNTTHPGICIGEQVALGKLTVDDAKKVLKYGTDESRTNRVKSAVARYKEVQASKPVASAVQVTRPPVESKGVVKVLAAAAAVEVSDSESDGECNGHSIPVADVPSPPVAPFMSDAEVQRAFDHAYGRAEPGVTQAARQPLRLVRGLAALMQPSLIFVAILAAMVGYGAAATSRAGGALGLPAPMDLAPATITLPSNMHGVPDSLALAPPDTHARNSVYPSCARALLAMVMTLTAYTAAMYLDVMLYLDAMRRRVARPVTIMAALMLASTSLMSATMQHACGLVCIRAAPPPPPPMLQRIMSSSSVHVVDARQASITLSASAASTAQTEHVRLHAPGDRATVLNDTGAKGAHMFNCPSFFPGGMRAPDRLTLIRVANNVTIPAPGIGDAMVGQVDTGNNNIMVTFSDALYAPALSMSLISPHICTAKGVEVRFYKWCDILFHDAANTVVKFNKDYTMDVTILDPAQVEANGADVYTRGKSSGGGSARLPADDLAQLWGARLNVSAQRMRDLVRSAADAPESLAKVGRTDVITEATLMANGARLPAPAVVQPWDTGDVPFGRYTAYDIVGPLPQRADAGGAYYILNIVDLGTAWVTPYLMARKSEVPACIRRYIIENEGRPGRGGKLITFRGGKVLTDNERVIQSAEVRAVWQQAGVTLHTSCEYQPWQNPTERYNRSMVESLRSMFARGGSGNYRHWGHLVIQWAHVWNRVSNTRTGPDSSPLQQKYGGRATVAGLRVPLCAAFVNKPKPYREHKLDTQRFKCIHLCNARYQPGYMFEIIEGPRKGTIITSTMAEFHENDFPLKSDGAGAAALDFIPMLTDLLQQRGTGEGDEELFDNVAPGLFDVGDIDDAGGEGAEGGGADSDTTDADDNDGDAQQPGLRRSARTRGGSLPQTVFGDADKQLRNKSRPSAAYVSVVDAMVAGVTDPEYVPKSYADIANIPDESVRAEWYAAYRKEFDGLFRSKTLECVPYPEDAKVLNLHTLFDIKRDGRKKVRGVLGGDRCVAGVDYERSYSPTIRMSTVRMLCCIAATCGLDLSAADITQAYHYGEVPESQPPAYCRLPDGYRRKGHCARTGNIYGHPASALNWYTTFHLFLIAFGFSRSSADPCLYSLHKDGAVLHLLVYVDDLLIAATPGSKLKEEFIKAMGERFAFTQQAAGDIDFLGMIVEQRSNGDTHVHAKPYIEKCVRRFLPGGVHGHYSVPADKLLPKLCAEAAAKRTVPDKNMHKRYQSMVGALLYLATTSRPDVAYAVGMLTRCMAWPTEELCLRAERVLIYLHHTSDIGLTYSASVCAAANIGGDIAPSVVGTCDGMSDADWSAGRSTSGWVYFMGRAAIAFGCKKQVSTALSSCEAEIMAGSLAACDALFLRNLLAHVGLPPTAPTVLRMDNMGAINLSENNMTSDRSKHIERRHLHIRELVSRNLLAVKYIKTDANVADIFTKPLERKRFQMLRKLLMNLE